ncbi:MAG: diguanylate cyclase [Anaerolineaceae bacterium]|nr:diguanylate cyclase [Anaerolineaceae bacterium]
MPDHKANFDRLITTLSLNFIDLEPDYLDVEINRSLQMIGEFAAVDRSYVFLYSDDGKFMTNTHEWCAPGIEPQISQIQNFPVESIPWLQEIISHFGLIHVPNVNDLPPEANAEKEIFLTQSIRSLVVVPIEYSKKLIGFVGFDSVRCQKDWGEEDITLLQIYGSIIGRAIIQVKNKKELLMRERFFQKLNEISFSFLNARDIEEMLDVVVNQLRYIIMSDGCFISLWDDHHKKIIPFAASEPFSQSYKNLQVLPEEKTVTESVIENRNYLIVDNVPQSSFLSSRIANLFASQCLLGIPLIAENKKLGAILFGFNNIHHFSQEEISLAQQAAFLVSMALSKQLALQEAKQHAQEVEILRNSGLIVASTLEPELAIDRILDQLEKVVPFDYASVQMLAENCLEIKATKGLLAPENLIGKRICIPGDNPNTQIIQQRKPFFFADVQSLFIPYQDSRFAHIHSWLGVPLIVHDQILGMIALEKTEINFYNNNHVKLASAFADQVSISLYNAQLFQEQQHRALELDALRDTLFDVTNELELSQLLPAIVKRAVSLLNADGGELALYDAETQALKVVVSQSVGKDITGAVLSAGEGLFGKVVETLETIIIPDYMQWEDHLPFYDGGVVHSVIAAPLIIGKKLLGVIGIARTTSLAPFSEKDQNLLFLFGQQAAIAIKNAELFQKVQKLTKLDSLTGAYNRRGFDDLCHRELILAKRSNQPQSMLMIDIDFFKKINDQYGHPVGDQILILLSRELQRNLRQTDVLCRYGGEEFAILLPETGLQTATSIAERLRVNVSNYSFEVDKLTLRLTISIGISWMTGNQAELGILLDRADEAMYQAKRGGRNKVCVFNEA